MKDQTTMTGEGKAGWGSRTLLGGFALAALLALGISVQAASRDTNGLTSNLLLRPMTLLDPFTLERIVIQPTVESDPGTAEATTSPESSGMNSESIGAGLRWPRIRIPWRPKCRSPWRPGDDDDD